MAEPKTKPTGSSVEAQLNSIADADRRADCVKLIEIMRAATGEPPKMCEKIIGFGAYTYAYASGRSGTACRTGFACGPREISIYLVAAGPDHTRHFENLGRYKMGKACLKIRRLADVDLGVLRLIIEDSLAEVRRRHP